MGQRLVVHVFDHTVGANEDDPKATIYYHWSAYTGSAFEVLDSLLGYLDEFDDDDLLLRLIRGVQKNGGGVNVVDQELAVERYGDAIQQGNSFTRNDGIVDLSPATIQEARDWMEGYAAIYLEDRVVSSDVYWAYEDKEACLEGSEIDEEEFDEESFDMPHETFEMSRSDLQDNIKAYNASCGKSFMIFPDGEIGEVIQ